MPTRRLPELSHGWRRPSVSLHPTPGPCCEPPSIRCWPTAWGRRRKKVRACGGAVAGRHHDPTSGLTARNFGGSSSIADSEKVAYALESERQRRLIGRLLAATDDQGDVRFRGCQSAPEQLQWAQTYHSTRCDSNFFAVRDRRAYDKEIFCFFADRSLCGLSAGTAAYGGIWRARNDSNVRPSDS